MGTHWDLIKWVLGPDQAIIAEWISEFLSGLSEPDPVCNPHPSERCVIEMNYVVNPYALQLTLLDNMAMSSQFQLPF